MSNDLPQSAYLKETRSYKNNIQVAFGGYHKAKRPIEDNELKAEIDELLATLTTG